MEVEEKRKGKARKGEGIEAGKNKELGERSRKDRKGRRVSMEPTDVRREATISDAPARCGHRGTEQEQGTGGRDRK